MQVCNMTLQVCKCEESFQLEEDDTTPCVYNKFDGRTYGTKCDDESTAWRKLSLEAIIPLLYLILMRVCFRMLRTVTLYIYLNFDIKQFYKR